MSFYHNQVNVLNQFEQFNMVSVNYSTRKEMTVCGMLFFSSSISNFIFSRWSMGLCEFCLNFVLPPDGFWFRTATSQLRKLQTKSIWTGYTLIDSVSNFSFLTFWPLHLSFFCLFRLRSMFHLLFETMHAINFSSRDFWYFKSNLIFLFHTIFSITLFIL